MFISNNSGLRERKAKAQIYRTAGTGIAFLCFMAMSFGRIPIGITWLYYIGSVYAVYKLNPMPKT